MSKQSSAFFDSISVNAEMGIDSAAKLWDWVTAGASAPVTGHRTPLPHGDSVVYRGQSNANYSLSSSLYRRCRSAAGAGQRVLEADMQTAETAILSAVRKEGLGRLMTDGELLMVLQHHGIPTRLVDVSEHALEALFFAVDSNDGSSGRLFVMHLHGSSTDHRVRLGRTTPTGPMSNSDRELPWVSAVRGRKRASLDWTQTVALVSDAPLDPRMRAQAGKFLVGGLNRRLGGRAMWIRDAASTAIPADDYAEVSTLGVNFMKARGSVRSASWPASGWTLSIEPGWKPYLRTKLASLEDRIDADSMYPAFSEVRRLALVEADRALRQDSPGS